MISDPMSTVLRILAVDMIEQARSGHPGMPMGMADIAYVLWHDYLRHNPQDPQWPNRDRFILSNGHGCALLYALLHLSGYDLSIDDLRSFRQFCSRTPGHPERHQTPGVETTTGPLGQGFANAVGIALAEFLLGQEFNRPGFSVIDHRTYVFLGDGCLMEGLSYEAASLAGTWGLNKLIAFWDDNGISIDGSVSGWFTDSIAQRFAACGWRVIDHVDGHSVESIRQAIDQAHSECEKPVLVACRTVIGAGSPNKSGSEKVHGAPLGSDEVACVRQALGWSCPPFVVPASLYAAWDASAAGAARQQAWTDLLGDYQKAYPAVAADLMRRLRGFLPNDWSSMIQTLFDQACQETKPMATRQANQACICALAPHLPELIGGSADLTPSNLTRWPDASTVGFHRPGRYIHYGVREFAMVAIANGLSLYGAHVPFCGTFLTFSDYARNAIRMAALMRLRTLFVLTHDSIGVGEDGPTHQPIEHIQSLRLIPDLMVWRPCDWPETVAAWSFALSYAGPTALILSRQVVPPMNKACRHWDHLASGAYVLFDSSEEKPDVILIATGTEVSLAMAAKDLLVLENISVRVVSMPSTTVFDRQTELYRHSVLIPGVPCVSLEAGSTSGWYRYVGSSGLAIGLDHFGSSAPYQILYEAFGLTPGRVFDDVLQLLGRS